MDKDFISFRDFLSNNGIKMPEKPVFEDVEDAEENVENQESLVFTEDSIDNSENNDNISEDISIVDTEANFYNLYNDVNEKFSCDIHIDGTELSKVSARLVIESKKWNILFNGTIVNGKCEVPLKKLDILNEGETGKIKLEVLADGVIFTPWEENFIIKKKVKIGF